MGFYAPWDAASPVTVWDHGGDIAAAIAARFSVAGSGHQLTAFPDAAGRAALAALAKRPPLWLVVQNALIGVWNGSGCKRVTQLPPGEAIAAVASYP